MLLVRAFKQSIYQMEFDQCKYSLLFISWWPRLASSKHQPAIWQKNGKSVPWYYGNQIFLFVVVCYLLFVVCYCFFCYCLLLFASVYCCLLLLSCFKVFSLCWKILTLIFKIFMDICETKASLFYFDKPFDVNL